MALDSRNLASLIEREAQRLGAITRHIEHDGERRPFIQLGKGFKVIRVRINESLRIKAVDQCWVGLPFNVLERLRFEDESEYNPRYVLKLFKETFPGDLELIRKINEINGKLVLRSFIVVIDRNYDHYFVAPFKLLEGALRPFIGGLSFTVSVRGESYYFKGEPLPIDTLDPILKFGKSRPIMAKTKLAYKHLPSRYT